MPPRLGAGLRMLAFGDVRYLACFGDQPADFLVSLAPFLVFPLVSFLILVVSGAWLDGTTALCATLCWLLAPPVIAELFCRLWQRDAHWAKFATVMNWSRWLMVLGLLILAVVVEVLHEFNADAIAVPLLAAFAVYSIWLNVFMARSALSLSWGRALVVTLAIGIGTLAVTILPDYQHFPTELAKPPA